MNVENLDSLRGTLERPLTTSGWLVPQQIWLERHTLRYRIGEGGPIACRTVQPSAGLIETFVRLADATPERILQFARKFGLLGIRRRHDRPNPDSYVHLERRHGEDYGYSVLEWYEGAIEGGEPIRNWYFWSRKIRAALRLASSLDRKSYGSSEDWAELYGDSYTPPRPNDELPLGVTPDAAFAETRGNLYSDLGHSELASQFVRG